MKIKIVHLLLNPEHQKDISDERWESIMNKQRQSIECFEKLKYKFDSYTQQYSQINREELPWHTCWENAIINEYMIKYRIFDAILSCIISFSSYS